MWVSVWVELWQMQCCGEDFAVGSAVEWNVERRDDVWLAPLLGDDQAREITYYEDHHDVAMSETNPINGVVQSITGVTHELEPIPGEVRAFRPAPGTGQLHRMSVTDKRAVEREHGVGRFGGWIVELDVSEANAG